MYSSTEYLISAQRSTGGWGYSINQTPVVEPTAVALLAIRDEPLADSYYRQGINWLINCQNEDGGWGINDNDFESGWQTAWAVKALRSTGEYHDVISRGVDWLTNVRTVQSISRDIQTIESTDLDYPSALIWPWLPEQVGWIEPTALCLIAIENLAVSELMVKRIDAALEYFRKNRTPSGGWDIGNAGVLDTLVLPRAFPTALVLLSLEKVGKQDIQTIDFGALHQDVERDPTILTQSASLLAIRTLGGNDEDLLVNIIDQQLLNGSWNDNVWFSAWAAMALRGYL